MGESLGSKLLLDANNPFPDADVELSTMILLFYRHDSMKMPSVISLDE